MAAVVSTSTLAGTPPKQARSSGFFTRLFRDKPLGAAGGVLLLLFVVVGLSAQWIAPYGRPVPSMLRAAAAPCCMAFCQCSTRIRRSNTGCQWFATSPAA